MTPNLPQTTPFHVAQEACVPLILPVEQNSTAVERPQTTHVWGTDFACVNMQDVIELADAVIQAKKPEYFITANVNYLMLTEQYPRLPEVNRRCLAMIADGQPIVSRSRRSSSPLPERVAGSDLIVELAKHSADKGYRVYFLGAAPGIAQAAAKELQRRFPSLQVAGCKAPPFRQLTAAEHSEILRDIRSAKPDILLVAFGQPKGEFWIYDNLVELGVPLSIQLGASFDFLAGTARRAPRVWQKLGCEWLYRGLSEPRRLGPRYAANLFFVAKKMFQDCVPSLSTSRKESP